MNQNPLFWSRENQTDCVELRDIEKSTLRKWVKLSEYCRLKEQRSPKTFLIDEPAIQCQNRMGAIVSIVDVSVLPLSQSITVPHFFVFASEDLVIIKLYGTESVVRELKSVGVSPGISLDMHTAGINAISVCKAMDNSSVVIGREHTLELFSGWACVCSPINTNQGVIGFLDLSFHCSIDTTFSVPMLKQMARDIAARITALSRTEAPSFPGCQLTERETEVAMAWLENCTVPEIASKCGIKESTVRTYLKNIYYKLKISSKGELFIKYGSVFSAN